MLFSLLEGIPIVIIIYCVLNLKKKDYLWNLPISIGILPFVSLIILSINTTFSGSGLGDNGGFSSGLLTIVISLLYFWYIYLGAIILLILSIKKKKKNINENGNLSIYEKAIMKSLIATNIVFTINWFFVEIFNKPLLLYRINNNTYYGIGIRVEKMSNTNISYYVDYISLIVFLCIALAISFIVLKRKSLNNHESD